MFLVSSTVRQRLMQDDTVLTQADSTKYQTEEDKAVAL